MKCSSLDIFPKSSETMLRSLKDKAAFLEQYLVYLEISKKAIKFFLIGDFEKFDPHVGETACQIRAYQIDLLAKKIGNYSEANAFTVCLHHLSRIARRASLLFAYYSRCLEQNSTRGRYVREFDAKINIRDFCADAGVIGEISEDALYLTQMHLLSMCKSINISGETYINYCQTAMLLSSSKTQAKNYIKRYQISVSKKSVSFVNKLAVSMYGKSIAQEIEQEVQKDSDGRWCLPSSLVIKIIFDHMSQSCSNFILRVCGKNSRNKVANFVVSAGSLRSKSIVSRKRHVGVVISGESALLDEPRGIDIFSEVLKKHGGVSLVKAFMARHPQYPGIHGWPEHDKICSDIALKKRVNSEESINMRCMKDEYRYYTHNLGSYMAPDGCNLIFDAKHIYCGMTSLGSKINRVSSCGQFIGISKVPPGVSHMIHFPVASVA